MHEMFRVPGPQTNVPVSRSPNIISFSSSRDGPERIAACTTTCS
jgi:hypothetical protein